jgi:hypothetical protein
MRPEIRAGIAELIADLEAADRKAWTVCAGGSVI